MLLLCPDCDRDRRCLSPPRPGKHRCRLHAGGRYQQRHSLKDALPPTIAERYRAALTNIDLTSVFEEYGLVRTRMIMLAEKLDGSESVKWWEDLRKLCDKVDRLMDAEKNVEALEAIGEMMQTIRAGARERDQWDELLALNGRAAHLKGVQSQIEHRRKSYLTATEALALITNLGAAMREALAHVREHWLAVKSHLLEKECVPKLAASIAEEIAGGTEPEKAAAKVLNQWIRRDLKPTRLSTSIQGADDIVQARVVALLGGPEA